MKLIKLEIYIIDHDELGGEECKSTIESQRYPNWSLNPHVADVQEVDIGEWDDDHHLNMTTATAEEYRKYFKEFDK